MNAIFWVSVFLAGWFYLAGVLQLISDVIAWRDLTGFQRQSVILSKRAFGILFFFIAIIFTIVSCTM